MLGGVSFLPPLLSQSVPSEDVSVLITKSWFLSMPERKKKGTYFVSAKLLVFWKALQVRGRFGSCCLLSKISDSASESQRDLGKKTLCLGACLHERASPV